MNTPPTLSILQTNVRKSQATHRQLLDDSQKDILAIQEPYTNPSNGRTVTHPKYHTVVGEDKDKRVVFYVHKKYSLSEWSHRIISNQKILISLQTTIGTVHLHNVYNWDARLTVEELLEGIKEPREHVLVGDFNLYHRWWGGPSVL